MNWFYNINRDKAIVWFIRFVFLCLLIFSIFAWFERMNTDAGYYLFKTINKQNFHIEHGRFVLAIAELLPLWATWAHLPLKIVIIAYSLNHVLFYIFCAWLSWRLSNNHSAPLAIAMLGFCGLRESIFTPQFELYYGLVAAVVCISWINHCAEKQHYSLFAIAGILIAAALAGTSHPMGLLCLYFMFLLNEVYFKRSAGWHWFVALALLVVYYFWKKNTVSDYEGSKFTIFFEAFKSGRLRELARLPVLSQGIRNLWHFYPDVLLLFITGIVFWWKQNKKKGFIIYAAGVVFFLCAVWLVWDLGASVNRYLEQVYYPFVFSAFIFVFWVRTWPKYLLFVLLFSLGFRAYSIAKGYNKFHQRTVFMDTLLEKADRTGHDRYIVFKKDMGEENYEMADWSYGFETMVRSTITLHKTITITKDEDIYYNGNDTLLKPNEYLERMWEIRKTSTLNPTYFKMKDGRYKNLFK